MKIFNVCPMYDAIDWMSEPHKNEIVDHPLMLLFEIKFKFPSPFRIFFNNFKFLPNGELFETTIMNLFLVFVSRVARFLLSPLALTP